MACFPSRKLFRAGRGMFSVTETLSSRPWHVSRHGNMQARESFGEGKHCTRRLGRVPVRGNMARSNNFEAPAGLPPSLKVQVYLKELWSSLLSFMVLYMKPEVDTVKVHIDPNQILMSSSM